ncbi:MAG: hypothetical protein H6577_17015 [Lewinellaceae bacterium]|nr:hypothetical protein [Lewinellaceae bacterium]
MDNFCSVIFAFCSYAVLVFVALNMDVVAVYAIGKLLGQFLPENLLLQVRNIAVFAFISLALSSTLFSIKQFKETKYARRFQYPFFRLLTKIAFHIFYRPINRLSLLF